MHQFPTEPIHKCFRATYERTLNIAGAAMEGSKALAYEAIGAGAGAETPDDLAADTSPWLSTIASIAIAATTMVLLIADFMLKAI
jgi:hypothetical protein